MAAASCLPSIAPSLGLQHVGAHPQLPSCSAMRRSISWARATAPAGDPAGTRTHRHIRRAMLSGDGSELQVPATATLDLTEIDGKTAVPVEYRKGRPRRMDAVVPDDPGEDEPAAPVCEPWPTDRIQVGLQTLLLEEAGIPLMLPGHVVVVLAGAPRASGATAPGRRTRCSAEPAWLQGDTPGA